MTTKTDWVKSYAIFLRVTFSWVTLAALITHIIVCIKSGAIGLLIVGLFIFPVGFIHGIGVWFGAW